MTTLAVLILVIVPADAPRIATIAGTGKAGYSGDGGPAKFAELRHPFDCAMDSVGNLFLTDTNNHCVRKIDAKGTISTVAGSGKKGYSGDNGPATAATLNEPYGVAADAGGNLFVVDRLNACVRKVDAKNGNIRTIAGTGVKGFSGDGGPGERAKLREPNGIALDGKGLLFIADVGDQRIRVLDLKTGIIETLCGNGTKARSGDGGPVSKATLYGPRAVAVAPNGSLFVVEREGHCVRTIDLAKGTIDRFAGTGEKGYFGDDGPALKAKFDGPKEIEVDPAGNVFVVDSDNGAIRRIDAKTNVVTTVAGGKKHGGLGDAGTATNAQLDQPHGVAVGKDGALYICDTLHHRIRVVK